MSHRHAHSSRRSGIPKPRKKPAASQKDSTLWSHWSSKRVTPGDSYSKIENPGGAFSEMYALGALPPECKVPLPSPLRKTLARNPKSLRRANSHMHQKNGKNALIFALVLLLLTSDCVSVAERIQSQKGRFAPQDGQNVFPKLPSKAPTCSPLEELRDLSPDEFRLIESLSPLPPLSAGNQIDQQSGMDRNKVLEQAKRFKSIGIDPHYHCEQYGGVFRTKVKYLTDQELADYRVVIKDGKLFDSTGQNPITALSHGWRKPIFIMDRNGAFYLAKHAPVGHFHHSSFKAGQNVAAAGEMIIRDGVLEEVTNFSGHYKPSEEITRQAVCELRRRGVHVPESIYSVRGPKPSTPKSCPSLVAEAQKSNENLKHPAPPHCGPEDQTSGPDSNNSVSPNPHLLAGMFFGIFPLLQLIINPEVD